MQYDYKEVYFGEYCKQCKFSDVDDIKDPCNECLSESFNFQSHKPTKYVQNKNVKNKEEHKYGK